MRYVLMGLLLVASTANADDWRQIGKLDSNGSVLLLDFAGVSEVKGLRRAWFRSAYTSDQLIPTEFLGSVPKDVRSYRSEVTLRYFNCPDRTSAVMRYYWNGTDNKRGGYFYQELLAFRPVPPATLDEQMLEAVCNFTGHFADATAANLHLPGEGEATAKLKRLANPDDFYPSGSKRRGELGSPVVQVCVGPKGALLREPVVTDSSGFPDLDNAAIKVAKANRYAAGMANGTALPESCIKFKIKFTGINH